MLNDSHRRAEELAAAAASALAGESYDEARHLYAQAAELEEQAFRSVPEDRQRTRSILGVSLAALLYKAQLFERAEIAIFKLLGSQSLQQWAISQLRELLQVVSDERLLENALHAHYSGESITVALRGGEIGSGTGPLDLILDKAAGFRNLLYRFAEWKGEYPLRRTGSPPKALLDLIQARVTEPAIGSYKLEIRLTEPLQADMFTQSPISPRALSDAIFDFYDSLTGGNPQRIEEIVPEPSYRKAFLQLTRAISPRGGRVREIGLYRTREDRVQSVYLTDALPARVSQVMALQPEEQQHKEIIELRGNLRALHLDKNWLEITLPNGSHEKCYTLPDMLDDVVGPMVNRRVVVSGTKARRGRGEHLLVQEIDLAENE